MNMYDMVCVYGKYKIHTKGERVTPPLDRRNSHSSYNMPLHLIYSLTLPAPRGEREGALEYGCTLPSSTFHLPLPKPSSTCVSACLDRNLQGL